MEYVDCSTVFNDPILLAQSSELLLLLCSCAFEPFGAPRDTHFSFSVPVPCVSAPWVRGNTQGGEAC